MPPLTGCTMQDVPGWLKYTYGALVVGLVPVYVLHHGVANFLWFSNIALLATLVGIWRQSRLLISMMAVGVLLPEVGWNLLLFGRLLFGWQGFGALDYMFDERIALWVRLLSLYHVPLPGLLFWLMWRDGYDPRALRFQILLAWVVLPVSYAVSTPWQNINLVYGPLDADGLPMLAPPIALFVVMVVLPTLIYWPTHALLRQITERRAGPLDGNEPLPSRPSPTNRHQK
jgi:hypothetical protein